MANAGDFFIYWGSGSMPCMRPMIVLEEKGFSGYGNKLISFSDKGHKSEEIMKLNPRGQVPTFKHGDIVVNESFAICHYLENQFKKQGTQLIPDDAVKQALVLQRMHEAENIHEKAIRNIFYYHKSTKKENVDEEHLQKRRKELATELDHWENYITGDYLVGESFTMADIYLFTYLCVLVRGSLPLDSRPNMKRYYEKLSQRPSIQASWPPHYKESPRTQMFALV